MLLALPRPAAGQRRGGSAPRDWTRGAVCYEIFVRSFYDSNGDGIGDLNGVTAKLDYINDGNPATHDDLGARCIWLMPVAASPSYHGYDVTDYYLVEPDYGTNADFKRLMAAAHRRGIRVLVDMVLNHVSSQHPFFVQALRDTASPYRGWFRWSRTRPAQLGPWGQEVWHRSPVRDEYYYGVFTAEMPDLNYENPAVLAEAEKVARYWLTEMGVDGFRLDAVPYLVERGTRLMHTAATHQLLHDYAAYVHRVAPGAFTVGEVWDGTGALLPYYPDQLDDYFAFELSDAIVNAVRSGSARALFPVIMRLQRSVPAGRWSPFLRNHDETRTMTELHGDIGRAKLAATLLLTMPGLPFVYYGEEIGMTGDKPDPRLRTPMQWSPRATAGFTSGQPWEPMQPDTLTANVETETADAGSLLAVYRRLIRLRASEPALASGALVPLAASSDAVAAYLRRAGDRTVLVLANLDTLPVERVTLSSSAGVLPAGRYTATTLLEGGREGASRAGADAAPLRVGTDRRIRGYVALGSISPGQFAVYRLERAAR